MDTTKRRFWFFQTAFFYEVWPLIFFSNEKDFLMPLVSYCYKSIWNFHCPPYHRSTLCGHCENVISTVSTWMIKVENKNQNKPFLETQNDAKLPTKLYSKLFQLNSRVVCFKVLLNFWGKKFFQLLNFKKFKVGSLAIFYCLFNILGRL